MTNAEFYPQAQQGGVAPQGQGAIEVTTSFFPLNFLLTFFPTKVHIDGSGPIVHKWGTVVYPVAPGQHQVRAYCPYLILTTMGDSSTVVNVAPGQVVRVRWKSRYLCFLAAPWVMEGDRALTAQDLSGGAPAPQAIQGAPVQQQMPPQQAQAQPAAQPAMAPAQAPAQAAAQPAGWHPDPQGQHKLRYWDGGQWTDHVNDD